MKNVVYILINRKYEDDLPEDVVVLRNWKSWTVNESSFYGDV